MQAVKESRSVSFTLIYYELCAEFILHDRRRKLGNLVGRHPKDVIAALVVVWNTVCAIVAIWLFSQYGYNAFHYIEIQDLTFVMGVQFIIFGFILIVPLILFLVAVILAHRHYNWLAGICVSIAIVFLLDIVKVPYRSAPWLYGITEAKFENQCVASTTACSDL